jgi:hypothetical protein
VGDQAGSDPRGVALAEYLRSRAAAFSLTADVTTQQHVAHAGMALLDAAAIAEHLTRTDPSLARLTEAGCYESMPDLGVRFVETEAVRAAVQRPLSGEPMTGRDILMLIAAVANADPDT